MPRLAADLPDAAVGLAPALDRLLDLRDDDRPDAFGHAVAGLRVQVDGVEQRTPHVVLVLIVRAIADPHRLRVLVPVRFGRMDSVRSRSPPSPYITWRSLPSWTDRRRTRRTRPLPNRTRACTGPTARTSVRIHGVSVVPVPLAARRLGQRGGGSRHQRAGGRVREALQRERTALQVDPPGMVGNSTVIQPLAPSTPASATSGRPRPRRTRRFVVGPRRNDEPLVAVAHGRVRVRALALEAQPQIAGEPERQVARRDPCGRRRSPRSRTPSSRPPARSRARARSPSGARRGRSRSGPCAAGRVRLRDRRGVVGDPPARCVSSYQGPTRRASRITSHPVRVCQVVSSSSVPGT